MSKPTITSSFELSLASSENSLNDPLRVLIVGDFSGQGNVLAKDNTALASVKPSLYRVDKDNFEEVFTALEVKCWLHEFGEILEFNDIDDFHPDGLFDSIALFAPLSKCLRKIKKCTQYHDALKLVCDVAPMVAASIGGFPQGREQSDIAFSLDEILGATQSYDQQDTIVELIAEAVKPIKQEKADPQVAQLEAQLLEFIAEQMRKVLQDQAFKRLESLWRALALVNREADTDRQLHLHILNIPDEISADIFAGSDYLTKYQALVSEASFSKGQEPFDVVVFNAFGRTEYQRPDYLMHVAQLASELNQLVLTDFNLSYWACGESEQAITAFIEGKTATQNALGERVSWQPFKQVAADQSHLLVTPRLLLRLPYGVKTHTTASFPFEELDPKADPKACSCNLLWGSGAIVGLLALEQVYFNGASQQILSLPFFAKKFGLQEYAQPPVEILFSDKLVALLKAEGLCVWAGSSSSNAVTLI